MLSHFSRVWLFEAPWTVVYHAPLSIEVIREEYWSGLPIPSPEDLPDPGIEPGGFFTTELPGKSMKNVTTPFIQEFFLFLVSLYDNRIAISYHYYILNFLNKDFMDIRLLFGYKIPP